MNKNYIEELANKCYEKAYCLYKQGKYKDAEELKALSLEIIVEVLES